MKCRYRDYDDADLCPHPLGTDPQGAHHPQEGTGCSSRLLRRAPTHLDQHASLGLLAPAGDIRGDLLCVAGQVSYALYLTIFGKLAKKYSVFTVNKWMFLWATLLLLPFTASEALKTDVAALSTRTLLEVGYVVFFGTFVSYLLMINGQRTLRPTVVSMYNYMQPLVAVVVSVTLGLAVFTLTHALAVALIFSGVWLVAISRSRQKG